MIDRVVMNVIHVMFITPIVFDAMFPKTALPNASFAFLFTAGVDTFAFVDVPGKARFDQHPTGGVIMVGFGSCLHSLQMIR